MRQCINVGVLFDAHPVAQVNFYLNGELLTYRNSNAPAFGQEVLLPAESYVPCVTFGREQQAVVNFGTLDFRSV